MPVKLSNLASKTAPLTLLFGTDELNIEYYPNLITDEKVMAWKEAQTKGEQGTSEYFQENNETFISFIKSWDLLEDDDVTPVALMPERMISVPVMIKQQILEAIMGEMQSGEATKPQIKKR